MRLCECGCGSALIERTDRTVRFASRQCAGRAKRGVPLTAHPLYKGGLSFDKASGRWKIMCRDGTQTWYYRAVMEAELGRPLREDELVHHRNEDPSDDRIENLQLTTRVEHPRLHAA